MANAPLRIVYISEGFPPETDARAARVFYHSKYWAKAGHHVSVITKTPNHPLGKPYAQYRNRWHSVEQIEEVDVHRIWSWLFPNESALKRMLSAISFAFSAIFRAKQMANMDVVIGTSPTPLAALAGYCISRLKKAPFIFEVRDVWPETLHTFSSSLSHRTLLWLMQNVVRLLYQKAQLIVCVTQGQIPIIRDRYNIAAGKIHLIPNGADLSDFSTTGKRDEYRKLLGWDKVFIVFFAGNHGHNHNLSLMLRVAQRLRHKPGIRFVLIGEGCEKPALMQMKEQYGLDNVVFYDQKPRSEMPAFYEAADLCFIPLHAQFPYDHAMPVKLYESMAMGLPVLFSGRGEAVDAIEKAQAGLSISPENVDEAVSAIEGFVSNPQQFSTYRNKGRAFIAQHYTREKNAGDLLRLIEQLCHRAP